MPRGRSKANTAAPQTRSRRTRPRFEKRAWVIQRTNVSRRNSNRSVFGKTRGMDTRLWRLRSAPSRAGPAPRILTQPNGLKRSAFRSPIWRNTPSYSRGGEAGASLAICARSWGDVGTVPAPHLCHPGTTVWQHQGPVHPAPTRAPQPPSGPAQCARAPPQRGRPGAWALDLGWALGPRHLEPECPGEGLEADRAWRVQGQVQHSREAGDRPAGVLLFDTLQRPHWAKGSSLESVHGRTPPPPHGEKDEL